MKNDEIQKLKDTLWANTWSNKEIIEEGIATLKQAFEYRQEGFRRIEASGLLAIYTLQQENKQLKQRDEVIDEAINKCELEIRASSYQYEKNHKQQELCYKVAHERIMEILNKYKGDNK